MMDEGGEGSGKSLISQQDPLHKCAMLRICLCSINTEHGQPMNNTHTKHTCTRVYNVCNSPLYMYVHAGTCTILVRCTCKLPIQ